MKFETWKEALEECFRREKLTGKVHVPCACKIVMPWINRGFFVATSCGPKFKFVNE